MKLSTKKKEKICFPLICNSPLTTKPRWGGGGLKSELSTKIGSEVQLED